ncbi:MAG: SusC/RagA family TonB-linked outer membrane protein [Tannerella sp.]|jgi:TonB-linked SusC/RagA family outer membrane protein|nr:SusC/RagA family TonB-linked outer membrane protein [Tannerella sp.]
MKNKKILLILALLARVGLQGFAQDGNIPDNRAGQVVNTGNGIIQNLEETTSSTYTVSGEELNKRSSRDIGSSMFGNVLGVTALQGNGNYFDYNNTFYVRGLQTLQNSGNAPLILVDGIERDIRLVSPEEVESVTVLKDAAATALYGYKGANGAINIVTRRGKYESREVKFSYDHAFNRQVRRPEFVDAFTYGNAMNEALVNDGQAVRYSEAELQAFKSGTYPSLYPNIDWIEEAFKNSGATNIYNVSFRGGGKAFRYYAMADLHNNSGFIKSENAKDGYSTQDKFSRSNLRTNLDIDLTPTTKLELKILGTLAEMSRPGDVANLWDMIYTIPAAAFPIKNQDGIWAGNSTWNGTLNPVAQSQDAGYTKMHRRSLFADMALKQDLSIILPGLGGSFRMAYDNVATYLENHSRTYSYGSYAVTEWLNGAPNMDNLQKYTGGTNSALGTSSELDSWTRAFNFDIGLNYRNTFGDHSIYSQFKWDYEYRDIRDIDNTWYRQNLSLYAHYGYKERYYADIALVASAANKLAPSSRWGYSPTVSAAWVLSKEDFMSGHSAVDFMKLRASFGIINRDNIPVDDDDNRIESYWEDRYVSGTQYPMDGSYNPAGAWKLSRLATQNPTHEKAIKYNIGLDAAIFGGLNLTIDGYYQKRKNIWVLSNGKYSTVLGFDAPYENGGIVDSYGFEAGADYYKTAGDFNFNIGATFTLNKNEIKEQYEETRAYDNLIRTNKPVGQLYGLIAEGFFKDQADIEGSVPHAFNQVRPGDIKYKDVNNDGKVDDNDVTAIGYNTLCPEIYYSFKLGAEYKGLGLAAMFQGTGNYSAILDTKSLYRPLVNNANISVHYYENRWTPDNQNAKYPALSSQSSNNNFKVNTIWLEDRSFLKLRHVELYYRLPETAMRKTGFIDNAKLYVRGVDLLCFDKIEIADPESYGATTPLNRSVVVGLTLGF